MTEMNTVFEDGKYYIYASETLHEGDEVEITSSEFEFDSYRRCFQRNCRFGYEVDLEIIEEDLTNFELGKACNGGCYAYATAIIREILLEEVLYPIEYRDVTYIPELYGVPIEGDCSSYDELEELEGLE